MPKIKLNQIFNYDNSVFGIDIGHGSVKIVQASDQKGQISIQAYGYATFDPSAIENGVIKNFEVLAEAIHNLITTSMIGKVTTPKVAISLPVNHSFNRIISIPVVNEDTIAEAVALEAEQYIPIPINDLYLDYKIIDTIDKKWMYLFRLHQKT